MKIDLAQSGFTLCERRRDAGDIWSPVQGGGEQLFHSVRKLYAPDPDTATTDDLPFVEMINSAGIKY